MVQEKGQEEMKKLVNKPMTVHLTRQSAKCPVCGETFFYDPEHAWKIGKTDYHSKKVCSYSCMRKWEKENHIKRKGDKK